MMGAVFCDECGKALNPNDDSVYYGAGVYCSEHMPEDAEDWCGECGAHMNRYQAQTDVEAQALALVNRARSHTADLFENLIDADADTLRGVWIELGHIAHYANLAKAELQILAVNRQVAATVLAEGDQDND